MHTFCADVISALPAATAAAGAADVADVDVNAARYRYSCVAASLPIDAGDIGHGRSIRITIISSGRLPTNDDAHT